MLRATVGGFDSFPADLSEENVMWVPAFARPKEPCATCGITPITPLHGDCDYTRGHTFCTLDCRITFRWRKKFAYLDKIVSDPKYQHQVGKRRTE